MVAPVFPVSLSLQSIKEKRRGETFYTFKANTFSFPQVQNRSYEWKEAKVIPIFFRVLHPPPFSFFLPFLFFPRYFLHTLASVSNISGLLFSAVAFLPGAFWHGLVFAYLIPQECSCNDASLSLIPEEQFLPLPRAKIDSSASIS